MTQDLAGLEDYISASAEDRVENTDGTILPVAGYECLRLPVDQGNRNFTGPTRELKFKCVAHVLNLGQHNSIT